MSFKCLQAILKVLELQKLDLVKEGGWGEGGGMSSPKFHLLLNFFLAKFGCKSFCDELDLIFIQTSALIPSISWLLRIVISPIIFEDLDSKSLLFGFLLKDFLCCLEKYWAPYSTLVFL